MAVIEVSDLRRKRGETQAIDGISFQVEAGQIFGLLGPNGAGKTSTIEVLEGLEKPDSGSVRVFDQDMATNSARVKQRIGVQLQTTGLPRYLTVAETLSLFASLYERDLTDRIPDILDRLGLQPVSGRLNSRLSGGERQRVALALALVNDPEILFLDEPSAGLDPHARRDLWGIISELRSGGKSVFLTTHDMHEAEHLCDEVAIMNAGIVVAQGTVTALIAAEAKEQPIWMEADGSRPPSDFPEDVPGVSRLLPEEDGILIYSTDPMATMTSLLDRRRQGKVSFASLQVKSASLEDVFLRRTGRRLEP
ncbi:MAG TPA: ABC transporter ATP-binding protein [Chloroflexota bacterium]|jgi:ABC-2 type transport system ATP-binding protein|nr:ABC transporter ATP-binding protein [Chloroflexota bacterium]